MTLKEIAKQSGVSVSTVSRVINKKGPHVARPEIQNRIWELVNNSGYSPDKNAQRLRKGDVGQGLESRSGAIACLFARSPESIGDPFFSQLARSVESAAYRANYGVRYSLTEIDLKSQSTIQAIRSTDTQGVVVLGRCDKQLLHSLKQYFPCVSYTGLNPLEAKYDQIICDGEAISQSAVDYLVRLGHKQIGYIGETSQECRYNGYLKGLDKNKLRFLSQNIENVPLSSEGGYRGAKALLNRNHDITAVLCANDLTAIGAMRALGEMGIRIPQDLSVMGIDDIEMSQYMATKLTTVHIPVEELGEVATSILLDRINGGHSLHLKVELPFYIVERESCAKPNKKGRKVDEPTIE